MRNHDTSPSTPPVPARHRRRPAVVLAVVAGALAFSLVVVLAVAVAVSRATTVDGPGGAGRLLGTAAVGAALGRDEATGEAGGVVPPGTSPFDEDVPAVSGLDPRLLDALQRATTDAGDDDVVVVVNGGWRSAAYQERLLDDAVAEYGSRTEAARWVATPETSAHVHGDAVDVGSWDATSWLSGNGAAHGLCQIYENESWHYELRPEAADQGCPPMFRDPTEDPRMHP
jgi:D-alanyl-D-alanine carboxypeptidase